MLLLVEVQHGIVFHNELINRFQKQISFCLKKGEFYAPTFLHTEDLSGNHGVDDITKWDF